MFLGSLLKPIIWCKAVEKMADENKDSKVSQYQCSINADYLDFNSDESPIRCKPIKIETNIKSEIGNLGDWDSDGDDLQSPPPVKQRSASSLSLWDDVKIKPDLDTPDELLGAGAAVNVEQSHEDRTEFDFHQDFNINGNFTRPNEQANDGMDQGPDTPSDYNKADNNNISNVKKCGFSSTQLESPTSTPTEKKDPIDGNLFLDIDPPRALTIAEKCNLYTDRCLAVLEKIEQLKSKEPPNEVIIVNKISQIPKKGSALGNQYTQYPSPLKKNFNVKYEFNSLEPSVDISKWGLQEVSPEIAAILDVTGISAERLEEIERKSSGFQKQRDLIKEKPKDEQNESISTCFFKSVATQTHCSIHPESSEDANSNLDFLLGVHSKLRRGFQELSAMLSNDALVPEAIRSAVDDIKRKTDRIIKS